MTLILNRDAWTRVKFGDVVRNVNANVKDPASVGIGRVIGLEHLDPGELAITRWASTDEETTFTRKVQPGQTLFGKRRAYQRKTAYANFDAICSGDILVFDSKDRGLLLPELLPFIASSDGFYERALETSAGSLSPRTRWSDIASYEFDLPPIEEQKRIADLLWSSHRNVGVERELVERLHGVRVAFVEERLSIADVEKPLGQLVEKLGDGPFGSKIKTEHYSNAPGTRVLRLQDVGDGRVKDDDVAWLRSEYVHASLASYLVEAGDFVVAGLGDERNPVGRAALAEPVAGSVHKADIFRGKPKTSLVSSEYLVEVLNSLRVRSRVLARAQGTTRMRINTTNMKLVVVPLLPLIEQQLLANELAKIDEAIVRQREVVRQSERLTQRLMQEVIG